MKNKITNYLIRLYGIIADKIYIWHPESIDDDVISSFRKKMHSIGLDIAYMKFVSSCDERGFVLCRP